MSLLSLPRSGVDNTVSLLLGLQWQRVALVLPMTLPLDHTSTNERTVNNTARLFERILDAGDNRRRTFSCFINDRPNVPC